MSDAATFEVIYAGLRGDLETASGEWDKSSRKGWIRAGLALAATVVLCLVFHSGRAPFFIGVAGVVAALILLTSATTKVQRQIKTPVLEATAQKLGLKYQPSGFQPRGYRTAEKALFGDVDTVNVSDNLSGERNGGEFAVYSADLSRDTPGERQTQQIFQGQVFAFTRPRAVQGEIAIVPDRGVFGFIKPAKQLQHVKIDGDREFEKKLDVYATDPEEAKALLTPELRRVLLDWRGKSPLFVHLQGREALVAISGKAPFQVTHKKGESMEACARRLYADVETTLARLDEAQAALA